MASENIEQDVSTLIKEMLSAVNVATRDNVFEEMAKGVVEFFDGEGYATTLQMELDKRI